MEDGGTETFDDHTFNNPDSIKFYAGNNDIFEARNNSGLWQQEIPATLATAIQGIDEPDTFWMTFYWGNWANWGTYNYDYLQPAPNNRTDVTYIP